MTTQQAYPYTHQPSESFQSRLINLYLRLSRTKGALGKALVNKELKNGPTPMPKSFARKYQVETKTFEGRELWTIRPKSANSDQVIFYIPGGAYIYNIIALHWTFLGKLVDKTNATVVVANYPVAPQANAETAYAYMESLYSKVLEHHDNKEIVFMADSAGGGLAIAFAQFIRDKNLNQPKQIIVLSPWLDISMSNPDILAVDKNDKALNIDALRKAGQIYAGNIATTDPRVSPIYGTFRGIAKLSIFMGTHDLFVADARKLRKKLEKEKIAFNYYEYPRMVHTWALLPMPEANIALNQMVDLLTN